jgi:tetratricopeptide (TPR) repeat protein
MEAAGVESASVAARRVRAVAKGLGAVAALLALVGGACALSGNVKRAQGEMASGNLDGAREILERERDEQPRSADVHVALGEVYYRIARDALDREHDEARYLDNLERSVGEFVTAVELDPRDDRPHFFLAMMDMYRGDAREALRGFALVKRLRPSGVAYTNIAETWVYLGKPDTAQEWNDLGVRKGAPYGAVLFNDMLIAWQAGDLAQARRSFGRLRDGHPEMLSTINAAPLPEAPRRFEDFAGYCCGSPACGPYLEDACRELSLDVEQRKLSEEAVRRELQIEMEKERRLRQVYEQNKELDIEIEREPAER